jgi:Mlc titration factor MtfA (ptsG expression regulator)
MSYLVVVCIALWVAAWLVSEPFLVARRRRRLRARPFPPAWREILHRRFPLYRRLPEALRSQLEGHMQVFLAEKSFSGCDGVEIDDEVRVTIAAQACLLILNRTTGYYPALHRILVYPSAFIVERLRPEPSGVLQEHREVLSGESWTNGQVVLSWQDVVDGASIADDGRNVAIHEFAHQLDQEKGFANGAPLLGRRERYSRWSRVLGDEFARLRERAFTMQPSLLSDYGATNPAEFFAVASEVFFEQPGPMAAQHPELYRELCDLYRVDPLTWHEDL